MQESFLKERGVYYRTNQFQAGRKTLVFVHGLSGSSSAWRDYETRFENDYNILTFDLRGHGKSLKPKLYDDYKISEFVSDIKTLTDFLKIETFALVGHSFGASVALEFLLSHREKVNAAVFLAPDFHTKGIRLSRLVSPLISLGAGIMGVFSFLKQTGGHIDYELYKNTGDWNIRRMFADIPNTGFHTYLYCLKQLYGFNRENRLGEIAVPTLIVHGAKDTVVPHKNSAEMAKKIKNSKFVTIEGTNHILVLNNFEETARAIGDFLS